MLGIGLLALVVLAGGWLGRPDPAPALRLVWAFSPASNTVTVRVTRPAGMSGQQVLAQSRLAVSAAGDGQPERSSAAGRMVRMPVPPGRRTSLLIRLTGPQPLTRTVTVAVPPPLRLVASRGASGQWLRGHVQPAAPPATRVLCGTDQVSLAAPSQVALSDGGTACRARLQLTAQDGEQAFVPVTIPALPQASRPAVDRLYCFASPAGGAVYITIDDGWTPSARVLAIMRRTHVPVTAFLIQKAAQENLALLAGLRRGGRPDRRPHVLPPQPHQAAAAPGHRPVGAGRAALGPLVRPGHLSWAGRPTGPSTARCRRRRPGAGCWRWRAGASPCQATASRPGTASRCARARSCILHWVPGLGGQLAALLDAIRALHLHPAAAHAASFARIAPQRRSLGGD